MDGMISSGLKRSGARKRFVAAARHAVELLENRVLLSVTPLVGPLPETEGSTPANIMQLGGKTFFAAAAPDPGLYVTDGTSGGTQKLIPLPTNFLISGGGASGGLEYIGVQGSTGQLWQTDGTAANTKLLMDFGSNSDAPKLLTDLNGTLFFAEGSRLWKSDGTAAGTLTVFSDTSGPPVSPSAVTTLNGQIVCVAGNGLWVSDGTSAGTTRISTVWSGSSSIANLNGTLYFQGNDTTHGAELWKTDGTSGGTGLVADIFGGTTSSSPYGMANINGELFFAAYGSTQGGIELWKSDGTSAGTSLVKDLNSAGSSNPGPIQNLNGRASFIAFTGPLTESVVVSDGTAAGTVALAQVPLASTMTVAGGKAYFSSNDSVHGTELWSSDGTVAGTGLLSDINPGPGGSVPGNFASAGTSVYFSADDGAHGPELWSANGTPGGTYMVSDLDTVESPNAQATHPILLGGRTLYYDGAGLWALDSGSTVPTRLTGAAPLEATSDGTRVFFSVHNSNSPLTSLWVSDGTVGGTFMLRQFSADQSPHRFFAAGGLLYFSGRDVGATLDSLWVSDGTVGGTTPLLSSDGNPVYDPQAFGIAGGSVFFDAYDSLASGGHGYELWKSDGSAAGTSMVRDIVPGQGSSAPQGVAPTPPAVLGGKLLFPAVSPGGAVELYSSDGTDAGTVALTNFSATPGAAMQTDFNGSASIVVMGGVAYFMAHDAAGVQSLWKTDGSAGGTTAVTTIDPGDAYPVVDLTVVGSQLFIFMAGSTANLTCGAATGRRREPLC